ncbi:hypothetical protein H9657_05195 [Cellulomonas sp. Sa3CUA2]|uniref:DUF4244 domain-containing protein n=1 Tax=Cellulomonas avistercoris TaxID=2762242 RepID=A0ABR8QB69_9CELL|nr:hypothetical protein [Cellulomonas avistercoris]MBD7917677.1 hypothetical protein [Cellulomonas avistercoris]
MRFVVRTWCALAQWAAAPQDDRDRGDVPGWVLVTLMTAGLVSVLWFVAGDALQKLFVDAISDVSPRSGT